jgi:Ca2+-binding RTX toxin-like protein
MRQLVVLAVVAVCAAAPDLASAQSVCPSTNRLRFFGQGGPALNLLDGASYKVTLGRTPRMGNPNDPLGEQPISAIVLRNGVCHLALGFGQWIATNASGQTIVGLTADSNLCFGSGDDILEILTEPRFVSCGDRVFMMNSMNYGNPARRLSTYGGGGLDFLLGGLGSDSIFGGFGDDVLAGVSSGPSGPISEDRLFGEDGNDFLLGSPPSGALRMDGGSGNDQINHQCRPATVTCGPGTDSVSFAPGPRPLFSTCETWSRSGC